MTISFILLNSLVIFSAHLLADRFHRNASLARQMVTTFMLYIFQVSAVLLLLGRVLNTLEPIWVALANIVISGVVIYLLRREAGSSISAFGQRFSGFWREMLDSRDYALYLLLILMVVQVTVLLAKIYYLPPHVGDVLTYHLHPLVDWYQQGKITEAVSTPVWRANINPLGAKFWHLWIVIYLGDVTWIELPQFVFGIIFFITAFALLVKLSVNRVNAVKYAVLIYFMPSVLLQSRTCQDHLILACCTLMAILYFISVVHEKEGRQVILLAVSFALLLSIKKHSGMVVGALFPALLLSRGFDFFSVRAFFIRNWQRLLVGAVLISVYSFYFLARSKTLHNALMLKTTNRYVKFLVPFALVLGLYFLLHWLTKKLPLKDFFRKYTAIPISAAVLALLIMGYGAVKYRNFLEPFFTGHTTPATYNNPDFANQYPAFNSKIMKNLLAFPFRVKDIGLYTSYTPDMLEKSGFGIQFFTFGLLAFILLFPFWLFKKSFRDSVMGFLWIYSILLLAGYFFVYFTWANYRNFIFFGVTGIMLWAFLAQRVLVKRYLQIYVDLLLVGMVVFNGIVCLYEGNMQPRQWITVLTASHQAERSTIKFATFTNRPGLDAWRFIGQYLAPGEPIGFSGGEDAMTFPYFDHRLQRRVYYINRLPGFRMSRVKRDGGVYKMLVMTDKFRESLRQRGIRFIHLSRFGTPHRLKLFMPQGTPGVTRVASSLYHVEF